MIYEIIMRARLKELSEAGLFIICVLKGVKMLLISFGFVFKGCVFN